MVTSRFNITQNSVKIFDSTLKLCDDQIAVRPGKLLTDFASNIMMLLEPTICFGFRPNAKNPPCQIIKKSLRREAGFSTLRCTNTQKDYGFFVENLTRVSLRVEFFESKWQDLCPKRWLLGW